MKIIVAGLTAILTLVLTMLMRTGFVWYLWTYQEIGVGLFPDGPVSFTAAGFMACLGIVVLASILTAEGSK